MPALDDSTKARIRLHLGYPAIDNPTIMTAGVPSVGEAQWLIERAMNHILDAYAADQVKDYVQVMDGINGQIANSTCLVKATVVGDIQPNIEAPEYLEREYVRWGWRLADLLGCCPNPFSVRYGAGGSSLNVSVVAGE